MQALPLANYLIRVSICRKSWISNLQLQKILYFLQIRSLIETGYSHPLIADDFEAWRFGPVVRDVYRAYSHNAGLKILHVSAVQPQLPAEGSIPAYVDAFFTAILKQRASQLVALSHRPNGAWQRAYQTAQSHIIPLNDIADEARQLASQHIAWLTPAPAAASV